MGADLWGLTFWEYFFLGTIRYIFSGVPHFWLVEIATIQTCTEKLSRTLNHARMPAPACDFIWVEYTSVGQAWTEVTTVHLSIHPSLNFGHCNTLRRHYLTSGCLLGGG